MPMSVNYEITALLFSHNNSQKLLSAITIENVIAFFNLKIDIEHYLNIIYIYFYLEYLLIDKK